MAKKPVEPTTMVIVHRKPGDLKNHPLNIRVYGDHIEPAFLEATKAGIESPLTVCQSKNPDLHEVVVKGRRRRMAAIIHEHKTVPCLLWHCDDPLEVERAMLVDNIRNETTVEERVRMYEELKRIEGGLAEQRQKAGKKPPSDLGAKKPQGTDAVKTGVSERAPKAADIAAAEVGLSRTNAEKGADVVHVADQLREAGEIEKADAIIEAVNTKPMAAAVRVAAEVSAPQKAGPTDDQLHSREIDRHATKLVASVAAAVKAAEEMMKAIDNKCRECEPMRSRRKKFETHLHKMRDMLDPIEHHAGLIAKSWSDTKAQVDQ